MKFLRHCEEGQLLCSCDFLISMNYFLDKDHFGKRKILYFRDQYALNFNTLDYEQSLFSLRDSLVSREKRTSELTSAKSPPALKYDSYVEPLFLKTIGVLLSKALPCNRLPEEIWCSKQITAESVVRGLI